MKLSKKITLVLSAIMLPCAVCAINNSAFAFNGDSDTDSDSSSSSFEIPSEHDSDWDFDSDDGYVSTGGYVSGPTDGEKRVKPVQERLSEKQRALNSEVLRMMMDYSRIGKIENGASGFKERPYGVCDCEDHVSRLMLRRKPNMCANLAELKAKLAVRQRELTSGQENSRRGLYESFAGCEKNNTMISGTCVYWVNAKLVNFDDRPRSDGWYVNAHNKWYGDKIEYGTDDPNGVAILFPLAADYENRGLKFSEQELRDCILDASNWIAIKGDYVDATGVSTADEDHVGSLNDYFEYLGKLGIIDRK